MPMPAPDFEQLLADGTRHDLDGDVVTVRLRRDVALSLPSGRVVAGEPMMFGIGDEDDRGFVQRVPPGRYPLALAVAVFEGPDGGIVDERNAAARLVIRDEPVVSWELARYADQDVDELGDDEYLGYPVDGGTGGFVDPTSLPLLGTDQDDYFDRLMECMDQGGDHTAPGTLNDADGTPLLVVYTSGWGDGSYPTWVGRTADGEVACFLTDFFVLTDEDDPADDDPADDDIVPPEPRPSRPLEFAATSVDALGMSALVPALPMSAAVPAVLAVPTVPADEHG